MLSVKVLYWKLITNHLCPYGPGSTATMCTQIQTAPDEVLVHHPPCSWEDTLYCRWVPLKGISDFSCYSSDEIEQFVQAVTVALPANQDRLGFYHKAQAEDNICSNFIEY